MNHYIGICRAHNVRPTYGKNSSVPSRWRPKSYNNWNKTFEASPRLAAVAHTQVVSSTKSPIKKIPNNNKGEKDKIPVLRRIDDDSSSLTKRVKQRLSLKFSDLMLTGNGDSSLYSNYPIVSDEVLDTTIIKPKQNFLRTDNHLADLKIFVKLHDLDEPIIKVKVKNNRGSSPCYYCTIQIGDLTCMTYPEDIFDELTAQQTAAKKALDSLEEQYQLKNDAFLIADDTDILRRIPDMVRIHPCGVWHRQIEETYVKQFKEQLPLNWLEIVNTLPCIAVLQIHGQCVLNFCNPLEDFQKLNIDTSGTVNLSVLPNTVKFDEDDFLIAEITCILSAGEVWCAQRETDEAQAFVALIAELEDYYNTNAKMEMVESIQIGGHYVALHDKMWCRVRVFEVNEDDVHCFCIDFGDEWIIKRNVLFRLNKRFAKEQAQAFVCRLAGVEELYEASKTSEHLQSFLGKTVRVQVESNANNSEIDPIDPAVPVVLYDIESGAPINEEIITLMSMEMALPRLTINTPTEAYVTHALTDGSVYIQIQSKGFEHLMFLIEKAGKNILSNEPNLTPVQITKSNCDDMYFIQYNKDNLWYRIKVIDWHPQNEKYAQIFFIDNGVTDVMSVKDTVFYKLDEISEVLSKFPPQGYLVHMSLKSVPNKFIEQIRNLVPTDEAVLVKCLKIDEDYAPVVEIFKRSRTDNVLFSINMTLAAQNDLKIGSGLIHTNNNIKLHSTKIQKLVFLNQFEDVSKNVPSTGLLMSPSIPTIGNYFDVRIPCAVHPHNFFVQPYHSQPDLNKLMTALQERYKDVQYSPLQISDVFPGKIYASKHDDGKWYRTSVIKVINTGSISVFYCDFGYYTNLAVYQLVPLDDNFMELPSQAIKAKLADIKPKYVKWTMEDCTFFSKLVCRKSFVSILKSIEKDILYRSDIVLNLKLIDTSTNTDIFIDQLLIDRGIAISTD
ncbi:hypothetical protein FQA39_LY10877 [Lamprigera yunnana]|nr:hypothetical protein FQA39_LY10877 [Lamprigera yunnana]